MMEVELTTGRPLARSPRLSIQVADRIRATQPSTPQRSLPGQYSLRSPCSCSDWQQKEPPPHESPSS